MSIEFNWNTYKEAVKNNTLEIGKKLSQTYYSGSLNSVNEADLIATDFVPSSGSLYCCEVNTDIALFNATVYGQTGFDFDALSSFVSSSGYNKVEYIFATGEENINPGTNWVAAASKSAVDFNLGFEDSYILPYTSVYNESPSTFYVKNIPLLSPSGSDIINLSRNKSNFREFMTSQSLDNYMAPNASYDLANNQNGDASPDVVVKDPVLDNRKGLTFYTLTDSNRDAALSSSLVEQFMVPDVSSEGYPVNCRGVALVYHQDINVSGSLWLRPDGAEYYWENDIKYTDSGSDIWNFSPTGTFGHFTSGTKVYMTDGTFKNIESVSVGESVKTSEWSGIVEGIMRPTLITDDKLLDGLNEPWRTFTTQSLDTMTVGTGSVANTTKFKYNTWVNVNNYYNVSPLEYIFIKDTSDSASWA